MSGEDDAPEDGSPAEASAPESDAGSEPDAPTEPADAASPADDAPLSDLARRVRERRTARADDAGERAAGDDRDRRRGPDRDLDLDLGLGPDADLGASDAPPDPEEDPFERMSVGEIDEETLWSSLESDEPVGLGDAGPAPAPEGDAEPLGDVETPPGVESVEGTAQGVPEHVVRKHKYCQSCPYLADPPELACTHDGTEIVEVVDTDRFRVRNCPMVDGGVRDLE